MTFWEPIVRPAVVGSWPVPAARTSTGNHVPGFVAPGSGLEPPPRQMRSCPKTTRHGPDTWHACPAGHVPAASLGRVSTHRETPTAAETEFLGLVAYGSLAAFERTAAASATAAQLGDKLVLARIAGQRFSHLDRLERELVARGSSLEQAMAPFVGPVNAFNQHSEPRSAAEALVKLCVIGGLVGDFAAIVGNQLGPELRTILVGSIDDAELAAEPGRMLAAAIAGEPDQVGRLALYGRRLLGEALSQAQSVASRHPQLTGLLTGLTGAEGDDLAAISELMTRLASAHALRMEQLGLVQ